MKIDITRDTFEQHKHFSRVLMQQGRVQIDADHNEQVAIFLHYMRTLAADLIGPHGGPRDKSGFNIALPGNGQGGPAISAGRYYVDGILCENDEDVSYEQQPNYPLLQDEPTAPDRPCVVYLDVWERDKTAVEDPDIREKALGESDTATRTEVVWQVKTTPKMPDGSDIPGDIRKEDVECDWESEWVTQWQARNRGMLIAKAGGGPEGDANPCAVPPEARYRGPENQLYRVEIHRPGVATQREGGSDTMAQEGSTARQQAPSPTFKWARDNGSDTFPIREVDGETVTLEHLGRDGRPSLNIGDWVEVVDDGYVLRQRAEPLLRVEEIDVTRMRVVLSRPPSPEVGRYPQKHPLLRRWDHILGDLTEGELNQAGGAVPLREGTWLNLEYGIQIYFQPAEGGAPHDYRTGDYWLIPARAATGDVEWPKQGEVPEARPPHGVEHHFAPLALIPSEGDANDWRCAFEPSCDPCPPGD